MKVAFLIAKPSAQPSGGDIYNQHLMQGIEREGVTICAFPLDANKPLSRVEQRKLAGQIAALQPDLMIQDELCHQSLFGLKNQDERLKKIPQTALVHVLSAQLTQNPIKKWRQLQREKKYLRSVDACIFVSKQTQTDVAKIISLRAKSAVIPPGRDHLALTGAPRHGTVKMRLLCVTNSQKNKGAALLLQWLSSFLKRHADLDWHLTLVGDLQQDITLKKILQQNTKLSERLTFTGAVSVEKMSGFYQDADLLIVPSAYESYGLVVTEAFGSGVPVLNMASGGVRDLVTDGENGFNCDKRTYQSFARHLKTVLQNPALLQTMGQRAKQTYESLPTWAVTSGAAKKFLTEIYSAN